MNMLNFVFHKFVDVLENIFDLVSTFKFVPTPTSDPDKNTKIKMNIYGAMEMVLLYTRLIGSIK